MAKPRGTFPRRREALISRDQWPGFAKKIQMTLELIAQLATLFLILGAGPIIVVVLYARGGNL